MARLGEMLVKGGICTGALVDEALEAQVIYGGRIGTNLLEIGAVKEEQLAQALSAQLGAPALWGDIGVSDDALALVRGDLAERLGIVPLRLEGKKLVVLTADPRDLRRLDELAFATGKDVKAVVVVESRLSEQLTRHYGMRRVERGVQVQPFRATARPHQEGPQVGGPDLMDEADFAALYDRASSTPVPGQAPTLTPPPLPGGRPAVTPPDAFRGALVTNDQVLAALQQEAEREADRGSIAVRLTPVSAEAPPLSFDEAAQALAGVSDRDAIARIVLRCALSRCRRALLLTVRGHRADGWEAMGEGLSPQTAAMVRVSLDHPGVFQTVARSRSHFLGPLQKTEANVRFLRALGGGAPKTSFAMPILARGRVVNVLYADDGRGRVLDSSGVGELLILATRISQSYDVLLSRAR
ncbi:MAG: general secretion pathway protein GspE [Deltaproteobacteria bacterium]|nr:general secretion pathway protein GspE [Deltaproteobacteria bacterium]